MIDFLPTGCPGEGYLSVELMKFEHRNEREMDAGWKENERGSERNNECKDEYEVKGYRDVSETNECEADGTGGCVRRNVFHLLHMGIFQVFVILQ